MRTYDFSPLYRSFVGFDRMANLIDSATQQANASNNYPPYNISQLSENTYKIELAVAGFTEETLAIESHENVLTVSSNHSPKADNDGAQYLHRGIAERDFEKRFHLADHVIVTGANLENGLLSISLKRELPEALKPRKIAINEPSLIQSKPRRKAKAA